METLDSLYVQKCAVEGLPYDVSKRYINMAVNYTPQYQQA